MYIYQSTPPVECSLPGEIKPSNNPPTGLSYFLKGKSSAVAVQVLKGGGSLQLTTPAHSINQHLRP